MCKKDMLKDYTDEIRDEQIAAQYSRLLDAKRLELDRAMESRENSRDYSEFLLADAEVGVIEYELAKLTISASRYGV